MENNTFYSFSSECIYAFKVFGEMLEVNYHELKVEAMESAQSHDSGHVYTFYKRFKDQSHVFSFIEKIYDLHLTMLSINKITVSEINKLHV